MKERMLYLVVVLFAVSISQAAYWSFYDNGGGDQLWSNPLNWEGNDPRAVPNTTNTDYAAGQSYAVPELQIDGVGGYAEAKNLITGVWGGPNETRLLNGVYFYLSQGLSIGYATAAGTPATFTNDGGTIQVGGESGQVFIGGDDTTAGNGALIQNGGSLTSTWRISVGLTGSGLLQINSGTVSSTIGPLEIGTNGVVDLNGGDIWFASGSAQELETLLLGYIANDQVIGLGGSGIVQYETVYDADAEIYQMHAWGAVPEPATMVMIALGGLLIRRKTK
jgi:hypothetical protein